MNRVAPTCATLLMALAMLTSLARSALACPVAGYMPPFAFRVPPLGETRVLSVASDGFFRIEVDGSFASDADEVAAIAVEVTDASGGQVSGSVRAFPSRPGLFWQADAALADGAYQATVSSPTHPDAGSFDFTLAAHGAPTPLALGTVELLGWLEIHELSGGRRLSCKPYVTCATLEFGEQEELLQGADLRVVPPPINGQVYWLATVERTNGSDSRSYPPSAGALFSRSGDEGGGAVSFPAQATEYCGILKMVDLRDDHALSSAPICWQPSTPRILDYTDLIINCPEPPSPALLPIWCRSHVESAECQGVGVEGPPGTAGSGGGAGMTASSSPPADDPVVDGSSSGCSIGRSRRASGLGAAALWAFVALGLRRNRRAGILLVCAIIGPFAFATGLQTSALKLALACSGAPAEDTFVASYSVVKAEGTSDVPVADDGFFLLRVAGKFAYPDEPETSITVQVRDATDAPVAGTLRSLDHDLVSWTADSKLAAGSYHATISAASNPSLPAATFELRSNGAREALRAAQLVEGDWFTQRASVEGPIATCQNFGDCGGGLLSFHERETSFRAVEVELRSPNLGSSVYWQMSLRPVPGKGKFEELVGEPPDPIELFFPNQAGSSKLVFADELAEYCVIVHAVDRRDGSSVDSAPQCWKPKAPVRVDADDATLAQLRQCDAPPSAALAARRCALQADHSRIAQCQDVADENNAGSAGTGGTDSGGAGDAGRSEEPPASGGARPDLGDDTGGEKSSSACSVGHSRGASGLVAAALMALAALGLRRRATRS